LQHGGGNCCHFFPDVLFQIHCCSWFLFVHLALEISSEEEVLRIGTLVLMNIEMPTKYPLSQERIVFFKYVSTAKAPCSTDQPSMANEMLWVSLEERSRTNSSCQRSHSKLFFKIVRYFCRDPVDALMVRYRRFRSLNCACPVASAFRSHIEMKQTNLYMWGAGQGILNGWCHVTGVQRRFLVDHFMKIWS
jgi:hypothetical protein